MEVWIRTHRLIYLGVLKHLLQPLLHLLEFARLDTTVDQQHAPKLSLSDSAAHRIVPFKLEGERHNMKIECYSEGEKWIGGGRPGKMGNSKYWCQASSWIMELALVTLNLHVGMHFFKSNVPLEHGLKAVGLGLVRSIQLIYSHSPLSLNVQTSENVNMSDLSEAADD